MQELNLALFLPSTSGNSAYSTVDSSLSDSEYKFGRKQKLSKTNFKEDFCLHQIFFLNIEIKSLMFNELR